MQKLCILWVLATYDFLKVLVKFRNCHQVINFLFLMSRKATDG